MPRWRRSATARRAASKFGVDLAGLGQAQRQDRFLRIRSLGRDGQHHRPDFRRRRGRLPERRPGRPGRAGSHAFLCRKRRADGRLRARSAARAARFTVGTPRKSAPRSRTSACSSRATLRVGDDARGARRRRAPHRHRAQSFRDASVARRPAQGARQARAAERARWSRRIGLRFDFSHTQAVAAEDLRKIEELVNSGDSPQRAAPKRG